MRPALLPALIFVTLAAEAHADAFVYGTFGGLEWREGDGLVEEIGFRGGVGGEQTRRLSPRVTLRARGELYQVFADYTGQSQDGVPTESESTHFGSWIELAPGLAVASGRWGTVELEAGLGYEAWTRQIENSLARPQPLAPPMQVLGYREDWKDVFARAGARATVPITSRTRVEVHAGVRHSVYTRNRAHLDFFTGMGDVVVHPRGDLGWFADVSYRPSGSRRVAVQLSYRHAAYDQSSAVSGVFQPATSTDVISLQVGALR